MTEKPDIKSMNLNELTEFVKALGEKPFRAKQLYQWMHKNLAASIDEMTNLPGRFRENLKENAAFISLQQADVQISGQDGTRKYLFMLEDENVIESVLMRYKFGNSACISSQAGCRMGCRFCASALGGFVRNLTPSEMLDQVYRIERGIGERISHVVVMGTGEPFDNYDALLRFLTLLSDENGQNIGQRNITVSTCGIVPNIYRFADEKLQITLAVSLHAAFQEKRERLMPVALRYDLKELLDACKYYFSKTGRRITFEYALASGENDSASDAEELSRLLSGINCHVNLIPVNPVKERAFTASGHSFVLAFKNKLEKNGINVTIRRELGRDIDAACGQLRKRYIENAGRTAVHSPIGQTIDALEHTDRFSRTDDTKNTGRQVEVMRSSSITDIGMHRKMNQDSVYASDAPVGNLPNLYLVADGMGGHNAGEYASRHTIETIVSSAGDSPHMRPETILEEAVCRANKELLAMAADHPSMWGMGTTIVAAVITKDKIYAANVGDSRLYIVNDGICQVTRDHSFVEEMVRRGEIDRESARNHPDKNIITRAVGAVEEIETDLFETELKTGDKILLCSDGLTNMVEDFEIYNIIKEQEDTARAAEELLHAANRNGGRDNITVIVIDPFSDRA